MHGSDRNRGRRSGSHHSGADPARDGWVQLLKPLFRALLHRIDAGLAEGAIMATLPDGTSRTLGDRAEGPRATLTIHRWRALLRLITGGSAGWYEAWAEGEWSSDDPVALFELFTRNRHSLGNAGRARGIGLWLRRLAHGAHRNSRGGSRRNIAYHYDLGNDFYRPWLDESMTYSSALFTAPGMTLEQAQAAKRAAILARTGAGPGDHVLEIGCGWGSFIETAQGVGVRVTGLTLSTEQKTVAEARITGDSRVLLLDYRDVLGQYDAVASIEMVEAVGAEYWDAYLSTIARVLKPGGQAAIQLISFDHALFPAYAQNVDFIQTYVFPGGLLIDEPRFRSIGERHGLRWQDRHGFALDYAETLKRWRARFDRAVAEAKLPREFDAQFVALWRYYLMYCEGGFRGGAIDVAQVTLVKEG